MSTPNLSRETCEEIRKTVSMCPGTVAARAIQHAGHNGHPVLESVDALLRAAKMHRQRFGSGIADDYVLGPCWLSAIKNARDLLCGDFGPVDNGTVESIFWRALDIAGFDQTDL
jgi:hypothetical protein